MLEEYFPGFMILLGEVSEVRLGGEAQVHGCRLSLTRADEA
jgi:hypothetical protein